MNRFAEAQKAFIELPLEEQARNIGKFSGDTIEWIADYVYDHLEVFQLLVCCAKRTEYENYIYAIVEIEVKQTLAFILNLRILGYSILQMHEPGELKKTAKRPCPGDWGAALNKRFEQFLHSGKSPFPSGAFP